MKVSAQYAQEHFADILTAIDTGEEVELTRPGQPSLFIAPRPSEPASARPKRPRAALLYAWEGKITLPTAEEWRTMDKEIEDEMLNGPISPPEHA
jgi:antitoxin (DNA-binding transcriptional repressor) of toxin-antitoxin stability system